MLEDKRPIIPGGAQAAWKANEDEEGREMQMTMTTDELCAKARSRESENVRAQWALALVLIVFGVVFAHDVFSVTQPWIRLGEAWMIGVMCLLAWTILRKGPRRIKTTETCSSFLEREFEAKRKTLLEVRRALLLVAPAFLASWWGGGPVVRARALGIDPSSWLFQLSTGPWPFLIVGLSLTLSWFALGRAAEKTNREIEAIRRYTKA